MLFLMGIVALCQLSASLGWSPLFRLHKRLSNPSTSLFKTGRHGARLWLSPKHQDGLESNGFRSVIPTNSSSSIHSVAAITSTQHTDFEYSLLQEENGLLRETIRQLEMENERLKNSASRIIIETFEGEGTDSFWFEGMGEGSSSRDSLIGITMTEEQMEGASQLWCDELDNDVCPVEPTISFGVALRDRALWLVGLLAMQSCSGFILARNELLLEAHPVIIYFLTMLIGAGGNAGNQASVRVIRGLALGTLNEQTQGQFLSRELKMAGSLSTILAFAGFARAIVFKTPFAETVAVTCALALIVFMSICLGAVLPLFLKKLGIDPAHSSTTIQVVMDILGVVLTVVVSSLILDSPFGHLLTSKLSFSG